MDVSRRRMLGLGALGAAGLAAGGFAVADSAQKDSQIVPFRSIAAPYSLKTDPDATGVGAPPANNWAFVYAAQS